MYYPMTCPLPPSIDLRRYIGRLDVQGAENACDTHSLTTACEIILARAGAPLELSRQFAYDVGRTKEARRDQPGIVLQDAIDVFAEVGTVPESLCPYRGNDVTDDPPPELLALAGTRKLQCYERIDLTGNWEARTAAIKSALAEGCPVVIYMPIGESLKRVSGPLEFQDYPGVNGDYAGVHSMLIVGYLAGQFAPFITANWWGGDWGEHGYLGLMQPVVGEIAEAVAIRTFDDFSPARRVWVLQNQDYVRQLVQANMGNPQTIIDACIDFYILPAELEWLMAWPDGAVKDFANGDGKKLNWTGFL